jgi:hypothetical protein
LVLVASTAHVYDGQARLVGVYHSDGTYEETAYTDCCTREVTDSRGVVTEYASDVLGRTDAVTRQEVAEYEYDGVTYAAQPEIVTHYYYSTSTPRQVQVTISGGDLQQVTTRDYDAANRLVAVTTGSTGDELKTLYEYGATTGGGQKVTVYSDYPTTATQGTSGVRDRISEYYCDGHVKSVTGSTAVGTYYNYGSEEDGQTWTLVATGTSLASPRYETTHYDMLRRTDHVVRPGWSETLTTTYYYNSTTGRLERVATPGQADTLYGYDSGNPQWRGVAGLQWRGLCHDRQRHRNLHGHPKGAPHGPGQRPDPRGPCLR